MTSNSGANARIPWWVYVSVALTALVSLYSLSLRHKAESLNKRVGIAVDWDNVLALAAGSKLSPEEALEKLKQQGVTAVVIGEATVGEEIAAHNTISMAVDVQALPGFDRAYKLRFGSAPVTSIDPSLLRSMSLGLDPHGIAAAKTAKLDVIARLSNPLGVSAEYVRGMMAWVREDGAGFFLPQGDQVLGRRDATPALRESLIAHQIKYCTPEFAKIGGDSSMVEAEPGNVIRLHSAQVQELDKLTMKGAVERYAKAVAERNQRMLLVRPLSFAGESPVASLGELVASVNREVTREGYTLGTPHPFVDSGVPSPVFLAIALMMTPALFWLGSRFVISSAGQLIGGLALALLVGACVKSDGRQIAALVAAISFPLLAFVCLEHWSRSSKPNVALLFLQVSAVSVVGGLAVAGLLNGLPFFVKGDAFMGVKIAHFLPMALIGAYFFTRLTDAKAGLSSPILWSQVGISMIILVAFVFMASRTGNDGPAGVSGIEIAFRSLLEQIMVVRPRTKEFLIGHPVMIIAIGLLVRHRMSGMNKGGWIALLLIVGAIGQTSMVNTMCHLHTPLTVSLIRIGVGLVLGGIIGAVSWAIIGRMPARSGN